MNTEVKGLLEELTCLSCSSVLTIDEKFCGECGTEVVNQPAEEERSDESAEQSETQKPIRRKKKVSSVSKASREAASKISKERLAKRKVQVKQDAIKHGRIAIMAVAILTFIWTAFQYISFNKAVSEARANPMMVVDEKIVSQTQLIFLASFAAGFLFLGFFFWAKKNPFSACLSALVIYVLSHVVAAVIEPKTIVQGILIKAIIIVALAKAISKAAELRAIEQEKD